MSEKNLKNFSNIELNLYKKNLSDEFISIKNQIDKFCEKLQNIEKEYLKVENELKIRGSNIY